MKVNSCWKRPEAKPRTRLESKGNAAMRQGGPDILDFWSDDRAINTDESQRSGHGRRRSRQTRRDCRHEQRLRGDAIRQRWRSPRQLVVFPRCRGMNNACCGVNDGRGGVHNGWFGLRPGCFRFDVEVLGLHARPLAFTLDAIVRVCPPVRFVHPLGFAPPQCWAIARAAICVRESFSEKCLSQMA